MPRLATASGLPARAKRRRLLGVENDETCRRRGVELEVFGGYSQRETPGPIPNPVVKALSADGTAPGRCVGE